MSLTPQRINRSGRRRPRPRSLVKGADRGKGSSGLADVLQGALSISEKDQIDGILERRQREEASPRLEGADDDGCDGGGTEEAGADVHTTAAEEFSEAHADVFGRPPPEVERVEQRLMALEREVLRMPKSERRALTKAMRKHPLLFVNCPHTNMLLGQDDEDFNAAEAARRLARYWECRRALWGDRTCYAAGTFPEPVFADYKRFYERTLAVLEDPNSDEMAREDAARMLRVIHKRKVEALDAVLEDMDDGCTERRPSEENNRAATAVASLDSSALSMARDTSDEFKLLFLRAEDLMEEKAAQRLVRYWRTGLHLFGPAFQHSKRVSLNDIWEECSELFLFGQNRLMPEPDAFGRSIVVIRQSVTLDEDNESGRNSENGGLISEETMNRLGINQDHFAKVMWYITHAALERETCQRNGIVMILSPKNLTIALARRLSPFRNAMINVLNCVPLKLRAVHILFHCLPQSIMGFFTVPVGILLRMRMIVHGGDAEENMARLSQEFGIGADNMPSDLGGTIESEFFVRWLQDRRAAGH